MVKQLVFVIVAIFSIMTLSSAMFFNGHVTEHETAEIVADWAHEAQEMSKADMEYMRRNGAFDK